MRWRVYCCVPGRASEYSRFSYVTLVPGEKFFHAKYCGESGTFVTTAEPFDRGAAPAAVPPAPDAGPGAAGAAAVSHPGLDSVNAAEATAPSSTFNWSCVRNLIPAP